MVQYTEWRSISDGSIISSIPDSDVGHFDAMDLSIDDQDTVETWHDLSSREVNLDNIGSPTYVSDGINGKPSVFYDGSDDAHRGDSFETDVNQPIVYFVVMQWDGDENESDRVFDGVDERIVFEIRNDGDWLIEAENNVTGGDPDTNPHIVEVVFDGSDSELLIDGQTEISGDVGGGTMDGFTLGKTRPDFQSAYYEGYIGEVIAYDSPTSETREAARDALSNKWDISLD